MGFSVQTGAHQDEWDQVWQDYDRRRPAAARPQPVATPALAAAAPASPARAPAVRRRTRGYGVLLTLAAGLILAILSGVPGAGRYPAPAKALASLASLAPEEAEMPPLTLAVSRLAAESATAACWVMRLAPEAPPWAQPCSEP